MPPSDYEKRIVAMFDSFCKTVVRNCSRNLKRTKRNADTPELRLTRLGGPQPKRPERRGKPAKKLQEVSENESVRL